MKQVYNHKKGTIYAICTALLWGFLAIVMKVAVHDISSETVIMFRFGMAFTILFITVLLFNRAALSVFKKPTAGLFLCAILLSINYFGFIEGIKYTTPINAQIFIQFGPVLLTVLGVIIFKEQLNWRHYTGFLIFFIGYALFYIEQFSLVASNSEFTKGLIILIIAASAWAIFATIQKFQLQHYTPIQVNLFTYAVCTIIYIPLAKYGEFGNLDSVQWGLMLFMGTNTLLAYGALAVANKNTEANRVSIIITLNPIITFVLMAIFGFAGVTWIAPEQFSPITILGASIALSGAIFVILAGKTTPQRV